MKSEVTLSSIAENHSLAFADVARVVGIGLVVIQHIAILGVGNARHGLFDKATGYFGVLGVSILFVLSGYLLGRPYLRAVLNSSPLPDTKVFYAKRILRIYPLYAFAVVAIMIFDFLTGVNVSSPMSSFVSHLLFIHNFSLASAQTIEAPMWTMAVDAQFYLVLPILALVASLVLRRVVSERRPAITAIGIIGLALLGVVIRLAVMKIRPESASTFDEQIVYFKQLPEIFPAFACGLLIALGERTGSMPQNRPVLLAAGILLAAIHAVWRVFSHGPGAAFILGFAFYDAIAAFAGALIFCGLTHGRISSLLARAASVSYAVYLFHWPLLAFAVDHFPIQGKARYLEVLAAFVFAVIPVAWLAHTFVELPFLKIKARVGAEAPVTNAGAIAS